MRAPAKGLSQQLVLLCAETFLPRLEIKFEKDGSLLKFFNKVAWE